MKLEIITKQSKGEKREVYCSYMEFVMELGVGSIIRNTFLLMVMTPML